MKALREQLNNDVVDFAVHVNKETILAWDKNISPIANDETIADFVYRVAFSEVANKYVVEKKERGAGELRDVMKSAIAKGMTKKDLAAALRDLINK